MVKWLAVLVAMVSFACAQGLIAQHPDAQHGAVQAVPLVLKDVLDNQRLEMEFLQSGMKSPPQVARALGYVSVAMHDSMVLGQNVDTPVVMATAVYGVQMYLHLGPANVRDAIKANWQQALERSVSTPSDKKVAVRLGQHIARQIVAYARQDGSHPVVYPQIPTFANAWKNASKRLPIDPNWGQVKPLFVKALPQALEPPVWDSEEFKASRESFWLRQSNLTDQDKRIATKWAGDMGTPSPPGLWQEIVVNTLEGADATPQQALQVLVALDAAMHNGFVACWKAKFTYYVQRPQQWVRANINPEWKSFVRTPRFPAYPSGHSTISAAAAVVLGAMLPEQRQLWNDMAKEASDSRIVGGIHWSIDAEEGMRLGKTIGEATLGALK